MPRRGNQETRPGRAPNSALNANREAVRSSLFSREVFGRLLTLAGAAGILLAAVVVVIYLQECDHETSLSRQQGRQRVDQELEFLLHEIESVRSDVLYLAEQELLQRFLAGQEDARRELEREYVRFVTRRSVYDQIRFLDQNRQGDYSRQLSRSATGSRGGR